MRSVGTSDVALILAHGAGTSMRHPSLCRLQEGLSARGVVTVTFDFPYRATGRGMPDRMPVLVEAYRRVIDVVREDGYRRLFIGGRSMGGRAASHVAAEGVAVNGLVFLGFPLHQPGKPSTSRAAHLDTIEAPMLFVQGTRDTFAEWALLSEVLARLPGTTLHAIPDADHGFHVPKRTGRTDGEVLEGVVEVVARWMDANADPQ
jgi:hypothetical protein